MTVRTTLGVLALTLVPVAGARAATPVLPLAQVRPGMECTARTVIAGTAITSFDATVLDVVAPQGGEGTRILVRVSGPAVDATGVAEGFSGSPLLCPGPDGAPGVAGAISETVGDYGNHLALVTPIAAMLGEPVRPPASASRVPGVPGVVRPVRTPLTIAGLSAPVRRTLAAAARRAAVAVLAAPPAPLGAPIFPPQPLVPGASVAAGYSRGDISAGAVGTVTYRDGGRVWAFGHQLDGAGRRSLLLQDAYVYTVVANPLPGQDTSYKLAAPGHVLGTLSADAPSAVVGAVGAPPRLVRLTVRVRDLDTGQRTTLASDAADETDVGLPLGSSPPTLVAPLLATQAVTQAYDGAPADESGRACLRVRLRELRRPLGFCSRYVLPGTLSESGAAPLSGPIAGGLGAALGLVDSADFARLHLVSAEAGIEIRRGLRIARLTAAAAPRAARRGQTIVVRLRARARRGPALGFSVRLRVPRNLRRGAHRVGLHGPDVDQEDADPTAALASALGVAGGAGAPEVPSPRSLRDLRRQVAALGGDDGLRATFSGRRGRVRIAPDPQWRISGIASLRLVVR